MARGETAAPAAGVAAPAEATHSLGSARGRLLVATFVAAHVSHHLTTSLLNPLLPFIRDSFALSYAQSGLLVSAFSLSSGVSNAPIGALADRIGSRPVVAVGLLLTGLVSVAVAFAGGYWELLGLLLVMGTIAGSYHAPSASLLARAFPASVRGAAMGFHITGGHMSFFLTPLLAAWLVGAAGTWRAPFLWLAAAPLALGVALWYLAPRERERARAPADLGRLAVFREIGSVFRLVGPLVSTSIVAQMVHLALFAFTTLYLVDGRGIAPLLAVVLSGVPQMVGMLGAPLGGFLSDRLGRRTVILTGIAGLGPAYAALVLAPTELIVLPLAAVGLVGSMRGTVTEVLVTESAPPHRRATVLGGYYLVVQELGGVAAPVLGALSGALGIAQAFGWASAGLAALSAGVLLLHRRL